MNDETASHRDAPTPPGEAASERQAGRNWITTRRALLAGVGVAGLLGAVAVFRHLGSQNTVGGVIIHAHGRDMPPLRFTDENGAATSLAAFRGRVVLLNIWATWCVPCREEMLTLDRLQAALGGPHFEVVTASIDSGGLPAVEAFFQQVGVKHLRAYLDTFHEAAALAIGIPLTLLIDRDGREAGRKLGPATWDDPGVVRLVRRYLPADST